MTEQANVFTLERCDWSARPIERRPTNCPGYDDRLTHHSGVPSQRGTSLKPTRQIFGCNFGVAILERNSSPVLPFGVDSPGKFQNRNTTIQTWCGYEQKYLSRKTPKLQTAKSNLGLMSRLLYVKIQMHPTYADGVVRSRSLRMRDVRSSNPVKVIEFALLMSSKRLSLDRERRETDVGFEPRSEHSIPVPGIRTPDPNIPPRHVGRI
ncbi:LOW QUALITY PROTEIN: hypothetical protein T265_14916 [Opisthorchis viverrini]|uniref:Uncharacterized protein n=1 Tax=Opisthorchis viverrini TaxID=6198 RepID=A0A074Z531_OPIVI|nr:LOW QUALITY PROTEIN: hypothetical protein T265_14916 [Opisthorchis viverrini]KER22191.1 LOW QUALITY PROTEIN: hypothetical protein T265_14916 [Opisthorchis viverrini]